MAKAATITKAPAAKPSGKTVTVACKMPNGLALRVFEMIPTQVPVMGGGTREEMRARLAGPLVKINGCAAQAGKSLPHDVIGGYGLTPDVDADFFSKWLHDNRESDLVKNHIVFAYEDTTDLRADAREHRKLRSGMEAMEQTGDPRAPRPSNPNLGVIEPAEKD